MQCSVEGCEKPDVARGWCRTHYSRWQRHGDVNDAGRRGRQPIPLEVRFWAKVRKGAPDECWQWLGAKSALGYGSIIAGSRYTGDSGPRHAHRVSWELTNGPIPPGEGYHGTCVCHRCDNPSCVNPAHLFLGSQLDNIADRHAKGRSARHKERRMAAMA